MFQGLTSLILESLGEPYIFIVAHIAKNVNTFYAKKSIVCQFARYMYIMTYVEA